MSKKLLLILPDEVHTALKEYQIDYTAQKRVMSNLNEVLVDIIKKAVKRDEVKPVDKVEAA